MPQRARLWQRGQLGAVAAGGVFFPRGNRAVMFDFFEAAQNRLAGQVVELLAAQIIVAPFHVADAQPASAFWKERLLEKWHVLMKELLLQIFGAGRDDDPFAGTNDRK